MIENKNLVSDDAEVANCLNNFFSNIVKNLEIFSCIDKNTVLKEIRGLSTTKASQNTDIPVKILKENADYFAEFICIQFK